MSLAKAMRWTSKKKEAAPKYGEETGKGKSRISQEKIFSYLCAVGNSGSTLVFIIIN